MPIVSGNLSDCSLPDPNPCSSFDAWGNNAVGLLRDYPVPIFGTATQSQSTPLDQYRMSVKFDHNLGSKDRLNVTYLLENVHTSSDFAGGSGLFGVPFDNPNRAQTAGVSWTHTLSPTVLNQFKMGYVRRTANFTAPGTAQIPKIFTADALAGSFGHSGGRLQVFTKDD